MLTSLVNIWLELSPWLLLGAAVAGLLHVLVPADRMREHLSGRLGVLKAVALGIPLPLCSCGVIPAGIGLRRSGASSGAAVGFLISTPQTGVDSILVSGTFLGWPFALLKVVVALVTGLVGGIAADLVTEAEDAEISPEPASAGQEGGRLAALAAHASELIRSIWGWLIVGVLISALITQLIPQDSLNEIPVLTGFSALLIALVISLPLYICATASVPIAAALVAGGLPPGAALVFLMAGPATNIATLGAVYRGLGGRTLAVYLTTIVVGSMAAGMLFNDLLSPTVAPLHDHAISASWWRVGSAILLAGMILRFAFDDLRRLMRGESGAQDGGVTVNVEGMTCDGCAAKLQRELESSPDVDRADVSFAEKRATVHGAATEESVGRLIRAAGFVPENVAKT